MAVAAERGLVILAGAGISMAPPTSLPSWWDFNSAVLQALADRLDAFSSQGWAGSRLETLIERRKTLRAFSPDFMAQLMAEEGGVDYFRVLEALDSDRTNANHEVLGDLSQAGVVRAIITTNFDRLLELALTARGVDHQVFADSSTFATLPAVLEQIDPPLPVIKVHGTVADPTSLVDTLAQRLASRPESLETAIRALLARSPCIVIGFSGADLAYDPDYLALRPAAADGVGLTVVVQPGTQPLPAMGELVAAWGARGRFTTGTLPDWLVELRGAFGVDHGPANAEVPTEEPRESDRLALMTDRCRSWVDSLGTMSALNMFTALVDTNADDSQMLRYLMFFKRYYMSTEDGMSASRYRFEYNIGRRLLDRGLIGTIDPKEAGVVPALGGHDVEATAYADAIQFLLRGARTWVESPGRQSNEPGSALIEAEADSLRCLALKFGHGHVAGNVRQLVGTLPPEIEAADPRRTLEICWLAAEFAEEFGDISSGLAYVVVAYQFARILGDEPRRGAIAARAARLSALAAQYDDALQLVDEAMRISDRLALPVLRGDALAARGMTDVLRSHDGDAVEPLVEATKIFEVHQRRPRLTYALCDLVRASYYSGDVERANAALERARAMAGVLPGLTVQVLLAEMELLRHDKQWDAARAAANDLLEVSKEMKHEAGSRRAERALEEMATKGRRRRRRSP